MSQNTNDAEIVDPHEPVSILSGLKPTLGVVHKLCRT